jgi:WD40 repeat protein
VIVWDVAGGQPVGPPLIGHTNDVNSVAWGPDGRSLVSGSWDDTLILWRVNSTPWQQHACNIANRNLSTTEWAEFIGNSYEYKLLCPNN